MNKVGVGAFIVFLSALIGAVVARSCFPVTIVEPSIPNIVTKFDTVETLPAWFADSTEIWKRRGFTTDTINLIVSETVVDTQFIPVTQGCTAAAVEARPHLWPLLTYRGGTRFADTALVSTFDLRSGKLGLSKVFIPGILTAIEADSNASPRFTFEPFPKTKKTSVWTKLLWSGVGYGVCTVAGAVN